MKRLFPVLIVIGVVLRLVLMATTLHPDVRGHNLAAYLIAQDNQLFSFYDYISRLPRTNAIVQLYQDDLFIYPPLAYLVHGLFNKLLFPFYPQDAFWMLIYDYGQVYNFASLPWLLILLKTPYLVADGIGLWLILKFSPVKNRRLLALLWWFNPVTLYASYMVGQFDIYISVLLLAGYFLTQSHKNILASVLFGLAAAFKPFPLFLMPLLPGNKFKNVAVGVGTYLLILLPYLPSVGFRQYALFAPQTDKLVYAKILVSGSQYLPLFFVGLVLIYWWNWFHAKAMPLYGWLSAVPLLFYSVSHYHPQWFLWGLPFFLVAAIYDSRSRLPLLVLLACYIFVVLTFEPSLNFGLFRINFSLSNWLVGKYPPDQLVSLVRGAFAATSIALVSLWSNSWQKSQS